MQILKNIYALACSEYGTNGICYAIKGESLTLIDCGTDAADLDVIYENMHNWELDALPISHVLLTHAHYDHTGNAHILRQCGACIAIGEGDGDALESGSEGTVYYSMPAGCSFTPCKADLRLKDGDIVEASGCRLEVIATPGHSRGSVMYRLETDSKVVIFTGDALQPARAGGVEFGWKGAPDYDPQDYIRSMRKIRDMQADALLGGHIQNCLRGGSQLLRRAYTEAMLTLRFEHVLPCANKPEAHE